jgi:hypothetical protein
MAAGGRRSVLLLNATASSSGIAHASRHIESSAVKGMAKSEEPHASVRRLKHPALRQRKQSLVENAEDDLCSRGSRAQSTNCLIHSPASASECRHSRHTHVQQTTARLPASPQHDTPPPPPSQPLISPPAPPSPPAPASLPSALRAAVFSAFRLPLRPSQPFHSLPPRRSPESHYLHPSLR